MGQSRPTEKPPYLRTPKAPAELIGLSELKLNRTIPVWAGFSLHVLTKVIRDYDLASYTVLPVERPYRAGVADVEFNAAGHCRKSASIWAERD